MARRKRAKVPQESDRAMTAARSVLAGSTTQAAAARANGVTRQAVNQAIKRIQARATTRKAS